MLHIFAGQFFSVVPYSWDPDPILIWASRTRILIKSNIYLTNLTNSSSFIIEKKIRVNVQGQIRTQDFRHDQYPGFFTWIRNRRMKDLVISGSLSKTLIATWFFIYFFTGLNLSYFHVQSSYIVYDFNFKFLQNAVRKVSTKIGPGMLKVFQLFKVGFVVLRFNGISDHVAHVRIKKVML